MIVSTADCRWHAYADGQDAGIHDAAIFAHAAARTLHEQHVRESQETIHVPRETRIRRNQ